MDAIVSQPYDRSAARLAHYDRNELVLEGSAAQSEPATFTSELRQARHTAAMTQKLAVSRTPLTPVLPPDLQASIDESAEDMEALFVGILLKAMWKTIPESEFGMKGTPGEIYRDMFIDEVSKMSSAGEGIGLKQVIRKELMQRELGLQVQIP